MIREHALPVIGSRCAGIFTQYFENTLPLFKVCNEIFLKESLENVRKRMN
jgi:hypothetical protein